MTKAKDKAAGNPKVLQVARTKDQTEAQAVAWMAVNPETNAAVVIDAYQSNIAGDDVNLMALIDALRKSTDQSKAGDQARRRCGPASNYSKRSYWWPGTCSSRRIGEPNAPELRSPAWFHAECSAVRRVGYGSNDSPKFPEVPVFGNRRFPEIPRAPL